MPTLLAGQTVVDLAQDESYFPAVIREKALRVGPVLAAPLGRAYRAGVRIAFGTDSGVSRHGENWREFPLLVAAGVSPADALVFATRNAADLLGLDDVGTLEVGMRADIIALPASPLEEISALGRVSFVMQAGRIVKGP